MIPVVFRGILYNCKVRITPTYLNHLKYICLLTVFVFSFKSAQAQKEKNKIVETEFKVYGACEMCKERIENALSVKGVKYADWDIETKVCKVVFKQTKIEKLRLHELLSEAGHDTDELKASDENYANLHECCRYRSQGNCD